MEINPVLLSKLKATLRTVWIVEAKKKGNIQEGITRALSIDGMTDEQIVEAVIEDYIKSFERLYAPQ